MSDVKIAYSRKRIRIERECIVLAKRYTYFLMKPTFLPRGKRCCEPSIIHWTQFDSSIWIASTQTLNLLHFELSAVGIRENCSRNIKSEKGKSLNWSEFNCDHLKNVKSEMEGFTGMFYNHFSYSLISHSRWIAIHSYLQRKIWFFRRYNYYIL